MLRLLADGQTDAQIGERLFVPRNTSGTHPRAVCDKLGVNIRAAATRLALEHGLARSPDGLRPAHPPHPSM